jgi:hypothetical protein
VPGGPTNIAPYNATHHTSHITRGQQKQKQIEMNKRKEKKRNKKWRRRSWEDVKVDDETFGIFAPSAVYLLGFFKNLTNSITSSLASSSPATSANLTFGAFSDVMFL